MDFYFSDDCLVQLVFQCPGAMENHRSTVFREKSVRHDTPYSRYLRMLNIATGYSNNTLSCSELNGEHAGECFKSLRHIGTYASMSV